MYLNDILFALILILLIICVYVNNIENFVSKREKAEDVHKWFKNNDPPSYSDYKKDIKNSDVVEYTKAKKLYVNGNLSVDNIERLL